MKLLDNKLYYIGGVVRDEILGQASFDTDLCYEGNAIEFAKKNKLNIIKENPDFGTVRVNVDGKEVDIASTRTEYYPREGHLPVVKNIGCSLKDDLKRRDFTINAMAKRTTDSEFIDYFNGREDIKNKKLRILHQDSFKDDPTRIIRGLKFAVRFDFGLEEETEFLQNQYLTNINYDMSYHRVKKELVETFRLNKQKAFDKFIENNIYKLLGKDCKKPSHLYKIQENLINFQSDYIYMIYLGFFDLHNIPLTRKERSILDWFERLKKEKPTNNTPKESIKMYEIWSSV